MYQFFFKSSFKRCQRLAIAKSGDALLTVVPKIYAIQMAKNMSASSPRAQMVMACVYVKYVAYMEIGHIGVTKV